MHPFRFGVVTAAARSGDEWAAKARRVEALGFSALLTPDRLMTPLSPLAALATAAAVTRTLRVAPFVLAAGLRNPVLLAKECATLSLLSGGRFDVGLGAGVGADDFRMAGLEFGTPGRRVARLQETLRTVKALLHGQEIAPPLTPRRAGDAPAAAGGAEAAGEPGAKPADARPAGVRLLPPSTQSPHIMVAGSGRRLLEVAAREADVVILGASPADAEAAVAEKVAWVRAAACDRFPELELCLSLAAVESPAVPPNIAAQVRERLARYMRVDLDQIIDAGSPSVLVGSPDAMCDALQRRRDRLGISFVTVPDDLMDAFAPVVQRLSGT